MGIFTTGKPKDQSAPFQPATIPFNSPGNQPPQWVPPKATGLPSNYVPPMPQQEQKQVQRSWAPSQAADSPYSRQAQAPQPQQQPPIIVQVQSQPMPQQQFQQPQQNWQQPMSAAIVAESETTPTIVATDPNAPVFVKIDKYEDILTELSDMKGTINNIRNLAEVFGLVREVQLDSVGILDGLMKELERSQIKLDKILGRLEDVEERVKTSSYAPVRKVRPEEMGDIEERIKKIREEIGKLNK